MNVITPRKPIAVASAVIEPRRADARRSCKRAFVYRTSRSFAGKCPHRRTTRSGGRKPPVGCEHPRSARNAQCCQGDSRTTALVNERVYLAERAFVHRECRYFSVDRHRRAPGAAGVSQPWRTIRSWVVNVITPRKPIAVASAVTEPRRARPPLLIRRSSFPEHYSFRSASATRYRTTAG
jgi:hypothetical protein